MALRVYGSECDVRQTADGVLVLFHNARLDDGRLVSKLNYSDLADYRLPNGEKVPTFDAALQLMKSAPKGFKLIIEIKEADVAAIVTAVEKYGLQIKGGIYSLRTSTLSRSHCYE